MATCEDWENALLGNEWINVGARHSHYPAGCWASLSWNQELRELFDMRPALDVLNLTPDEVINLAAKL